MNPFRKSAIMLLTIPSLVVLTLAALPLPLAWLDANYARGVLNPVSLHLEPQTARSLLSIVATGAMTALSLTYSLVLVVFTLAAGNIGPRLLKRFTTEPVNQITAGLLGGTFLYCLVTLLFIRDDFLPKITVSGAGVLAVVSVLQLIYFVRHVSKSITIDDEIAEITLRLSQDISALLNRSEANGGNSSAEKMPETKEALMAPQTGYVGRIDDGGLLEFACEKDIRIVLERAAGEYVLQGEPLLRISRKLEEEDCKRLCRKIEIEASRSDARNVEFSTNLLVEIALRALSPGVNDTFTALACVDSLSNAFSEPVRKGLPGQDRYGSDKTLRVAIRGLSLKVLMGSAFHPLRRASVDNILMAQGVAKALARLSAIASDEADDLLAKHARLLIAGLKDAGHSTEDIESVSELLPSGYADNT